MSRKKHRKASGSSQALAIMPAESAVAATYSGAPFLLMGGGYQAASHSDSRGYVYWPDVNTRTQISPYTRHEIARRIQFLYAHFGFARKLVNGMARIMGYLTPQPNTSDEDWNELSFESFMSIAGNAQIWDRQGRFDFFDGQVMDNIAMDKDGDCVAVLTETPSGRARLAYYEAHQLATPDGATGKWVDGVKLNEASRHIAYGLRDGEDPTKITIVDAANCIYFGRFENRGQVRPLSILYAACLNMVDVLETRGFQKVKLKQSSQRGHVIEQDIGAKPTGVGGFGGGAPAQKTVLMPDGTEQTVNIDMIYSSGVSQRLNPGSKLRVITDDNPSTNFMAFERALMKDCADSVDLSYERLCDIAGITGPGVRILNQDEIRWKLLRILPQAKRCMREWNYIIAKEMKAGRLRYPKLKQGEFWWNRVEWIGLPDPGIDGGREARATVTNIRTGMTTWMEEAKTGGLYWKKRARQGIAETIFVEVECQAMATAAGVDPTRITPERVFPERFATTVSATVMPDAEAGTTPVKKKPDGDEPDPMEDVQPSE